MALSPKRRVFIEEYLRCWNASEAARLAGYRNPPNIAGSVLMSQPEIKAAIEKAISERAMAADEVLMRLAEQARGSMADFIRVVNGQPIVDLKRAEEEKKLHLIKALAFDKNGRVSRIELYDAQHALEKLGRALGVFVERRALEALDVLKHGATVASEELQRQVTGDQTALEALTAALNSSSPEERRFAAEQLGETGRAIATAPLAERWFKEKDLGVRAALVAALGRIARADNANAYRAASAILDRVSAETAAKGSAAGSDWRAVIEQVISGHSDGSGQENDRDNTETTGPVDA